MENNRKSHLLLSTFYNDTIIHFDILKLYAMTNISRNLFPSHFFEFFLSLFLCVCLSLFLCVCVLSIFPFRFLSIWLRKNRYIFFIYLLTFNIWNICYGWTVIAQALINFLFRVFLFVPFLFILNVNRYFSFSLSFFFFQIYSLFLSLSFSMYTYNLYFYSH